MLEGIGSPADLKKLDIAGLRALAEEIRLKIIETVGTNGGHLASNLGTIELTIALHKVFDSPKDAIVWDVGHQSYAHKLITGRAGLFDRIRKKDGLSGFPKRDESEHDIFNTGHSSTSISQALGLLEARVRKGNPGRVVAVIGDGALTAGMAFEGLSNAGQLGLPLIVILNDNKMSISRNVGSLSRYLSRLSASLRYQKARARIDEAVLSMPLIGHSLMDFIVRMKRAVKAVFFRENLFVDLGFEYVGPIDGHNMPILVGILEQVRDLERPVVVHVVTTKGKGYLKAEDDPESFHGVPPCSREGAQRRESFTEIFGRTIAEEADRRSDLVAISAAMTKGTGLDVMRKNHPSRVHDVGIAEQHAVAFAAGLATGGLKPVVAIYSTFMQRALDQVEHDVALPGLDVLFAVDRAGAVGEDGETHQGIFDLAIFRPLPRMTILAPADSGEMKLFIEWALSRGGPRMIRYPKAAAERPESDEVPPVEEGRGVFLRKRSASPTLVCALGPLAPEAARVSDRLLAEGLGIDVYSLRFACPIDEKYLADLCAPYSRIVTIEEGVRSGGVGESLAALMAARGVHAPVTVLGFDNIPLPQASRGELLDMAGLSPEKLHSFLSELCARDKGAILHGETASAAGR